MEGFYSALQILITGPILPASILVGLMVIASALMFLGAIDFDLFDFDIGGDADISTEIEIAAGPGSIFAATVRWLNMKNVPIILWAGVFIFAWWIVSIALWLGYDVSRFEPTWLTSTLLAARNAVIAVGATKLLTTPLIKLFAGNRYSAGTLMGQVCEISTSEATPEFGQARFKTDAAPLLLNIRTDGPHIPKGHRARIVGFDPEKRIYTVTRVTEEASHE